MTDEQIQAFLDILEDGNKVLLFEFVSLHFKGRADSLWW